MTCSACGASSRPGAKFCQQCGARLALTCPGCGAGVAPEQRFCSECGAHLPAGPAAPVVPPELARDTRLQPPSGYTPAHLAERILRERANLQGERKQVTILFADVSGFTSIAEALDPEEVHALMSRAFELMLAEVHRYEGTVNQFLGDGLMALFGAPVAHEDHARRAALAALGIQAALSAYREELGRGRGIDFRLRMGLNTGLVVVGAIGDNLRMDYTAVGDTTNVAARMQQVAAPGQTVVAESTWRLVEPYFELRPLGDIAVKNRAAPVRAWELARALPAPRTRTLAPFLGRADPLAVLERAAAAARAGRGHVAYVVGEPGIGKSRLLLELRERLADTMAWVEGHCLSFGQSTPFLPFVEALRQLFGITEGDSEGQAITKITRELEALGERARGLAPYLRFALSVDAGDPAVIAMDPHDRLPRILQGARQAFQLGSLRQPTVLVIEDLHWIDSASEDYLRDIIDGVAGFPMLLVLTWRPAYRPPFSEHTYVSRVVLEPLEERDARRLVQATLGIEDVPDELARVIARKAEGNPFFLEEIGRALLDTGAVRRDGSRLVLARAPSSIVVPDRIQDVIAARIDRLGEDQKRTVQVASVIGREFALRLLGRVADAADRVERALVELKALEFVYEKAAAQDLEYVFKHALTQDVAYESILQARRRTLHARIGAAIEELYADRLEERVEELAHHFTRGEVWERAASYCRQAGDRAAALCVDPKAVEYYERALEALGRLPATPETARLGIDLRLGLRAPLWRAGQLDRLFEIFKEAEALAAEHGETARLDAAYSFFVQYYWAKGEEEQAIAYGRRCVETGERRGDLGLVVTGHYYTASACYALGRYALGLEHCRQVIDLLERGRTTERFGLSGLPYCGACAVGARCLSALGDTAGALALVERGERVAEAADHLYSRVPLAIMRGLAVLQQGKVDEALASLEPTVAICRERKFAGQLMLALDALAQACSAAGRHEEAIAASRETVELQEKANAFVDRGEHVAQVARAYLAAGRLEEAEAAAREALGFARRFKERGAEGWICWVFGEVARRRGDRAAAVEQLGAARAIGEDLGARPLVERSEQSLGALG